MENCTNNQFIENSNAQDKTSNTRKKFQKALSNQFENQFNSKNFTHELEQNIITRKQENQKEEIDEFNRRLGLYFLKYYFNKPLRDLMILYILNAWFISEKQEIYEKYQIELIDENEISTQLEYGKHCSIMMQLYLTNKLRFCKKFAFQLNRLPSLDIKPNTKW